MWVKYGIREYPFSGEYFTDEDGRDIPLVYVYDDHNGTTDNFYLRRIDQTTSGRIIIWTQDNNAACDLVRIYNDELERYFKIQYLKKEK